MTSPLDRPQFRYVEAYPVQEDGRQLLILADPTGLAGGSLTVSSQSALFLFQHMDGRHTLDQIADAFEQQYGDRIPRDKLDEMVDQLDSAYFLDSPTFERYYESLVDNYRAGPDRPSGDSASYGDDGRGLAPVIQDMLEQHNGHQPNTERGGLAGLIVPHLDYQRGSPCYAEAYRLLRNSEPPERVIILGTNHFGRSHAPVATTKHFKTPLGTTKNDADFIARLSSHCEHDLCENEFDHLREHSVELQVIILQHILGPESFSIVPILCHDPCGPTGTAPYSGSGADLKDLGKALAELIEEDETPTLIVAGADLSHVGRRFGDDCDLDTTFLEQIGDKDRAALDAVSRGDRKTFLDSVAARDNDTRICSVGCMYTLMTALPETTPELLRYHQVVDEENDTCVTCSAVAFWR